MKKRSVHVYSSIMAILAVLTISCSSEDSNSGSSGSSESSGNAVVRYTAASQRSVTEFHNCFNSCPTDPANCDQSSTSPLCFPNMLRIQECETRCDGNKSCFPWDRGETPSKVCKWSNDPYACNFGSCFWASFDCTEDCFRTYAGLGGYNAEYLSELCVEKCYDHYGCKPRANDACNPLPEGYVYCGCPEAHGVTCHSSNYESCP